MKLKRTALIRYVFNYDSRQKQNYQGMDLESNTFYAAP